MITVDGRLIVGNRVVLRRNGENITGYFMGIIKHVGKASLRFGYGVRSNGERFSEITFPIDEFSAGDAATASSTEYDPMPVMNDWHGDLVTPVSLYTGYMLHAVRDADGVSLTIASRDGEKGGWIQMTRTEIREFARTLLEVTE